MLSEVVELKARISRLDSTIEAQNAEIKQLKTENERLLCMHTNSNSSISCNDKSTTNFQHPINHVVQDKNLTIDVRIADSNDDTIQDIQEVLSVSSSFIQVCCCINEREANKREEQLRTNQRAEPDTRH